MDIDYTTSQPRKTNIYAKDSIIYIILLALAHNHYYHDKKNVCLHTVIVLGWMPIYTASPIPG
jgi:hypothetical protein